MKQRLLPFVMLMALLAGSCSKSDDTTPPVMPPANGPDVSVNVPAGGVNTGNMKWVRLAATVKNDKGASYLWKLGNDTLSTTKELQYLFSKEGSYTLALIVKNSEGEKRIDVPVKISAGKYINGVTRVFDFQPAPGQFVHTLPVWENGDDQQKMNAKAEEALKNGGAIHLGGFGGYVVMGFDHTILNVPGAYSFTVLGNAFESWAEPGIIEVAYDANGNGLPDDEWYEIAGSEYNSSKTIRNYQITYYKPDENKVKTPNKNYPALTDTTYIKWKDNQGKSGYLSKNMYHVQPYYPQWKGDSITFSGSRLTDEYVVDQSGAGTYFVSPAFPFGYADNWSNDNEKANIKISWAVDKKGNAVQLKGVDFIRVYTSMRAEGGWLGEISTEVAGVKDLNLK
ncbi:PKD domain-containing protein [Chitinophaga sp. HK235]|uniref:PKD domain-containing protein n=1 Tax=Chitinophaga sp. HK235 TaxID=2952571 RepID=UPI001BA95786|nr:PKD domain-containing protein [Chitinophaga sp. HK235]